MVRAHVTVGTRQSSGRQGPNPTSPLRGFGFYPLSIRKLLVGLKWGVVTTDTFLKMLIMGSWEKRAGIRKGRARAAWTRISGRGGRWAEVRDAARGRILAGLLSSRKAEL